MELAELLNKLDLQTFIALDFETTGLNPIEDRITEFAAVRFEGGVPVDRYETLVNPECLIPVAIVRKTGISNEMVKDAPREKDIVADIFDFIENYPVIAHNLPFDYTFLSELKRVHLSGEVNNMGYDTVPLAQALLFFLPNHRLGTVAEYLGLASDGTHRAMVDTEILGEMFLQLIWECASYPLAVIQKVLSVSDGKSFYNKTLFENLALALVKNGNLKKGLVKSQINKVLPSHIFYHKGDDSTTDFEAKSFFSENGQLSKLFSGGKYEVRGNQIRYAELVSKTFSKDAVGILEAGTGLGKSLAYLLASLEKSLSVGGEPVIISCHTKTLQDQLFQHEIPKIASALDVSFSATVMKGRQNYVCLTRVNQVIADARNLLSNGEVQSMIVIIIWLQSTQSGDIEECNGFLNRRPYRLRSLIQSDPGFCTQRLCKSTGGCFLGPLRVATQNSDLIIVNHSFLLYELEEQNALPSLNYVVIDEGHNILRVGYNHFTITLSSRMIIDQFAPLTKSIDTSKRINQVINLLMVKTPEVSNYFISLKESIKHIISFSEKFFKNLSEKRVENYPKDARYQQLHRVENIKNHLRDVQEDLKSLRVAIGRGVTSAKKLQSIISYIPDDLRDAEIIGFFDRIAEQLSELINTLIVLTEDQNKDWVYWETGQYFKDKLELTLNAGPIDIGPPLRSTVFDQIKSIVVTSATLSVGSDFEYFLRRFGLDEFKDKTLYVKNFPSPFFYEDQCKYFQFSGDIAPSDSAFPIFVSEIIQSLCDQYGKRMLILFTSRVLIRECYDHLLQQGFSKNTPLLAQFSYSSRPALIKQFRRTENGVLLGTNSFWEGIDLPGDLLEILVVTRIPFDVPTDPIIQAYNDKLKELGGNPFIDHSVPAAAIRLRQGFGRLIRSLNDEGIFINLDNRVTQKQYGKVFESIIPVKMTIFSDSKQL